MTDEELRASLGNRPSLPERPSPVQHVSESLGCSDAHAAVFARAKGLIDADNMLHCWHCSEVCDWHVSLHCAPCRISAPDRKRERDRIERERQLAERQREQQEPSRPQQRVAGRSFRDEY